MLVAYQQHRSWTKELMIFFHTKELHVQFLFNSQIFCIVISLANSLQLISQIIL